MNFLDVSRITKAVFVVYEAISKALASLYARIEAIASRIFEKKPSNNPTPPLAPVRVQSPSNSPQIRPTLPPASPSQLSPIPKLEAGAASGSSIDSNFDQGVRHLISEIKVDIDTDWIKHDGTLSEFNKEFLTQVLKILEHGDSDYGISFNYWGKSGIELVASEKEYENRTFCKKYWKQLIEKKNDLDHAVVPSFAQTRFKEILSWSRY